MDITPKFDMRRTLSSKTKRELKENNLLTVEQYAKRKHKSTWAVRWMCRQGKLPCKRLGMIWVISDA